MSQSPLCGGTNPQITPDDPLQRHHLVSPGQPDKFDMLGIINNCRNRGFTNGPYRQTKIDILGIVEIGKDIARRIDPDLAKKLFIGQRTPNHADILFLFQTQRFLIVSSHDNKRDRKAFKIMNQCPHGRINAENQHMTGSIRRQRKVGPIT